MQTQNFSIRINAPVEKVWKTMLNHPTYEQWTTVFSEGSTYTGSREQGAEIKFVNPDGEGMIAEIAENRLHEYVSIHHLGEMQYDEKTGKMKEYGYDDAGYENYTFLKNTDGTTTLEVEMTNIPDEYVDMFNQMWPQALDVLKKMCEK